MFITIGYTKNEPIAKDAVKEVVPIPGFDGTGPNGLGPLTGRRRGRCLSSNSYLTRYPHRYSYLLPAASLLYRLGKRYVLPLAREKLEGIGSREKQK
jgi:hypothetical protein